MTTAKKLTINGANGNVIEIAPELLRGIHHLSKVSKTTGEVLHYWRHRATNEKMSGVGYPGTADFEALRKQLDARVSSRTLACDTLAGLWDARKNHPSYDVKVKSKSQRKNNDRIMTRFLAAQMPDKHGNLRPAFGKTPLDKLSDDSFYEAVQAYQQMLVNERKAHYLALDEEPCYREVDAHMTAIHALVAWGIEFKKLGSLKFHPLGKYTKLHTSNRAEVIFTEEQCEAWLRKAAEHTYARDLILVFLLALTTGQRAGDLRQLVWNDYRVVEGVRGFEIFPLKTRGHNGNGKVFVPVLPHVGDMLDAMRGRPYEKVLTMGGKPWAPRTLSFYFGNITRSTIDPKTGKPGLVAVVETKNAQGNRVFTEVPLHMHDLRGTAITRLREVGQGDAQIASITGHSVETVSRILKKYAANTARVAINAMNALASAPSTQRLAAATAFLKPVPMLTYQPANDELPEQLIPLQAAE